jgi:hypothetical protein
MVQLFGPIVVRDPHTKHIPRISRLIWINVDKGPIARAKLPVRLRQGLHGNWVDGAKLAA